MSIIMISGIAVAKSLIVHGGDSRGGTLTEFRRVKCVVGDRIEMLPVISGNSIRGLLRDACAEFSLRAAGIEKLKDIGAYHLLFSGGALTKGGSEAYVNVAEEKKLRELLPALSLFGGSLGNRILGGRLDVGEWVPLCEELAWMVPDEYAELARKFSIYDLVDVIGFTRRDDAKNRRLQEHLDDDTLRLYMQRKETLREANEAEEPGASAQMRYFMECLIPGTKFYVEFVLHHVTDVELGTFLGGLALFANRPAVGGRASTGLGRVELELKQVDISEPVRVAGEIALGKIELAQRHLAERRSEIIGLLEGILQ